MKCKICNFQEVEFSFSRAGENFYKCPACSIIFQYPVDSLKIEQYYGDEYFNKESRFVIQFINWHARDKDRGVLKIIKKYKHGGHLLDIGAAYGQFLSLAREAGFVVTGIEPNKESAKIAKEKFNIELEKVFFDKNYHSNQKFDIITNFHVIEHVLDPAGFLDDIYNNLNDNGIAVFETPNVQSLNYYIMGKKWPYVLPNEHLFLFSFKNLIPLLEAHGFKVIYKKRTGIFIHRRPKGLTSMIYGNSVGFVGRLLNILKNFVSENLGFGDHLFIVAKKVK